MSEHEILRRRKYPRLNDSIASSSEKVPDSCLDGLPDAASRNIVRHLSSAPSRMNWQSYVDGSDALASIQLKGPISVAACDVFTRVHIGQRTGGRNDFE